MNGYLCFDNTRTHVDWVRDDGSVDRLPMRILRGEYDEDNDGRLLTATITVKMWASDLRNEPTR